MADIAMCFGRECEVRDKCYRYTATPNKYRQSYMEFDIKPVNNTTECSDFRPNSISPQPPVPSPTNESP